jgi:hypothetical protein
MSVSHTPEPSGSDEVEYLLRREAEERAAADATLNTMVRDAHTVLAERYADKAHSIIERMEGPAVPSGLWPPHK